MIELLGIKIWTTEETEHTEAGRNDFSFFRVFRGSYPALRASLRHSIQRCSKDTKTPHDTAD